MTEKVRIILPDGTETQIELVHLDELLRRGLLETQENILYWEGEQNCKAADAMRKVQSDGEKVRQFIISNLVGKLFPTEQQV